MDYQIREGTMVYYETRFRKDLARYCAERLDSKLFGIAFVSDRLSNFPDAFRHIRFGCSGWEPENKYDFYFSLYFSVLTDTALHAHFSKHHDHFDQIA